MHKVKFESYVLFSGLAEDLSPGGNLSEGSLQKGKGTARTFRSFCKIKTKQANKKTQVVRKSKRLLLIKEKSDISS